MNNLAQVIKSGNVGTVLQHPEFKQQLNIILPKIASLNAEKMLRFFSAELRAYDNLKKCSTSSIFAAFIKCAQLGLEPGSLYGYCWLLPFYDWKTKGYDCQLVIGYKGLINLSMRSGQVKTIHAFPIYSKDKFSITYGMEPKIMHSPCLEEDRGESLGAYAVAKLINKEYQIAYMTRAELDKIKNKSLSKNKSGEIVGPWASDREEMDKKTVIKRLSKLLPQSTEICLANQIMDSQELGEVAPEIDLNLLINDEQPQENANGAIDPIENEQDSSVKATEDDMSRTEELLIELDAKRGLL